MRELLDVVSEGPPAAVVELSEWIAWRWCGPRVAVLRSASPPNVVRALEPAEHVPADVIRRQEERGSTCCGCRRCTTGGIWSLN